MPEFLVIGSIYLHQEAFAFSIVLLCLGILGKFLSYAISVQEKKESNEAGKQIVDSVVDNITNALAISSLGKNNGGFH
tara:strand:+ start:19627 stop:19860 length:234 start_codon:yes stop_codon:yes gene_type:complete